MANCVVNFNSPTGAYYSGQEVSGTITLFNEKPRSLRALLLKIEGFCETSWTEESGSGDDKRTSSYSGREDYMKSASFLVNNGLSGGEFPVGHHTFNFCFTLPLTIPSSYSHSNDQILYRIKVEMERKLKLNRTFAFPISVRSHLDLNYDGPELRQPMRGEISKKFFLGLGSNALTITAEIPQRAYVAGQTMTISVTIVNKSSINVDQTLVELHQHVLFKCDGSSTQRAHQILVSGRHGGVAVKCKNQMTFSMEIPPVEPTNVRFCKYIHITYEVAIIAKVGGLHRSPILSMPITIGTVALSGYENRGPSSLTTTTQGISNAPFGFALDSNNEKVELGDQSKS